jgi:hypothetical protein
MSAKLYAAMAAGIVVLLAGVIGLVLWARLDDRPSHQEGFKQMMDKKIHGREMFDGFTSDPTPRRSGK